MKHRDVQMLLHWMEAADIAAVEMSTPRGSVRLVRPPQAAGRRALVHVAAEVAGTFTAAHPLRGQPLAACGARVAAGDVLGLMTIDETFYLPILAPAQGWVRRRLVADGQPVEAGDPLFEFEPAADPSA